MTNSTSQATTTISTRSVPRVKGQLESLVDPDKLYNSFMLGSRRAGTLAKDIESKMAKSWGGGTRAQLSELAQTYRDIQSYCEDMTMAIAPCDDPVDNLHQQMGKSAAARKSILDSNATEVIDDFTSELYALHRDAQRLGFEESCWNQGRTPSAGPGAFDESAAYWNLAGGDDLTDTEKAEKRQEYIVAHSTEAEQDTA